MGLGWWWAAGGGDGTLDVADGVGDDASDEFDLAGQVYPWGSRLQFAAGQHAVEDAASVGQTDYHDVAWVWDGVGEQHVHDAGPDLAAAAFDEGVASGGEVFEEPVVVALDDAVGDEAGEGFFVDWLGMMRGMVQPEAGVVRLTGGDGGEGGVKEGVAGWRGVEEDEAIQVGVDAVFHSQVH